MTDRSPAPSERTVLMATPYFPPEGGGLERYATAIASRLVADHGWRVVFVTSGERGSQATATVEQGFKVYRLPAQVTLSRTPLALSWPRRVSAIARDEQAALVNAHAPVPGLADAAAMGKGRRPFVLTYHAGPMHKGKTLADGAIKLYEETLLRYTALRSDVVICNSNFVRDVFAATSRESRRSSLLVWMRRSSDRAVTSAPEPFFSLPIWTQAWNSRVLAPCCRLSRAWSQTASR